MNDSTKRSGVSRSIPTATGGDTGTGDAGASAAVTATGDTVANSTPSAKSGKRNTGNGRKAAPVALPIVDAISIFQEACKILQEAGLPVQAVNLPVQPHAAPRVAILIENAVYDSGNLYYTAIDTEAA